MPTSKQIETVERKRKTLEILFENYPKPFPMNRLATKLGVNYRGADGRINRSLEHILRCLRQEGLIATAKKGKSTFEVRELSLTEEGLKQMQAERGVA